jgi:hypothetical protein
MLGVFERTEMNNTTNPSIPNDDVSAVLWACVETSRTALLDDPHNPDKLFWFRAEMAAFTAYFIGEAKVH